MEIPEELIVIRMAWMTIMGMDQDEINEHVLEDPCVDQEYELKQLKAAIWLHHNSPSSEMLQKWATKY